MLLELRGFGVLSPICESCIKGYRGREMARHLHLPVIDRHILMRGIQGLLLSSGSPVGWLVLQVLMGSNPLEDIRENIGVYLYMSIGTAIAFTGFGCYVGFNEMRLSRMALVDSLTGVHNNRYFTERLHEEFANSIREQKPLSLMLIDLDNFKRINDRYGHLAGDQMLRAAAGEMKRCTRSGETLARVGGDEFCIILSNCNKDSALLAAERIECGLNQTQVVFSDGTEVNVSASVGVAVRESSMDDEHGLYSAADAAMYDVKARRRRQSVAASDAFR